MADALLGMNGKAIMVIGGGQGIGESTARFLTMAGADVAVVDVVAERARSVARSVEHLGRRGAAVVGDVRAGQRGTTDDIGRAALFLLSYQPDYWLTHEGWVNAGRHESWFCARARRPDRRLTCTPADYFNGQLARATWPQGAAMSPFGFKPAAGST